jgi:RND family efflux transporter MFP subunit
MGLSNEKGYPHRGTVDFTDCRVNAKTGSIQMRTVLANPKAKDGAPLLLPGMSVRVRLPIGKPYDVLLVTHAAIISEPPNSYSVYVVDAQNKIERRPVTMGPVQDDGLRVVLQGLKKDDRVVIGGIERVRPRMKVQPEPTVMPTPK